MGPDPSPIDPPDPTADQPATDGGPELLIFDVAGAEICDPITGCALPPADRPAPAEQPG